MNRTEIISALIEQKRDAFIRVSDKIWETPEIYFEEHRSAEYLCQALAAEGFEVEKGIAGLNTGFVASFGSGKPVVAILGEYDALAGLSQKKAPLIMIRLSLTVMDMVADIIS